MKFLTYLIVFIFSINHLVAQVDSHPIKSYASEDGKLYWNKKLPVYLRIASTPDDQGVLLKSENQAQFSNPLYLDTEGVNFIRTRWAVDTGTFRTATPQIEIMMEVYADGQPPIQTITASDAPAKTVNDTVYYGPGLTVSLSAKDGLSGVENIFYKINDSSYSTYVDSLNFNKEGAFSLTYYSLDNVGNITNKDTKKFIVDLMAPSTYHNINGLSIDNIITTSTKIYFTHEDGSSEVSKTYFKFDDNDFTTYDGKSLNTAALAEGDHILSYYSADNVRNLEEVKQFKFYFDRTAPLMAADVLGDRFIVGDQVYFSGRTKLKLTAVDNKVGVKEVFYKINDEAYKTYDQPFYLPSVSGIHLIRYYSLDNLSNQSLMDGSSEFKHNVNKVYVDLTGPDIYHQFLGMSMLSRDTLFINKETKIVLKGKDSESGFAKMTYNIHGNLQEIPYTDPFTVDTKGHHHIDYFGYDNVNNRNISKFFVYSDHDGPEVFFNFSAAPYELKRGLNVYSSDVDLFLAATDNKVGVMAIYYKINDGEYLEFASKVKNFKKNTKYKLDIKAVDLLGNETVKMIEFFTGK